MEKRLFLTILLCFGVMMFWSAVVMPVFFPPPPKVPDKKPDAGEKTAKPPADPAKLPDPVPPSTSFQHEEAPPHATTLSNGILKVGFTNRGATVSGMQLLGHAPSRDFASWNTEGVPLLSLGDPGRGHYSLWEIEGGTGLITGRWKVVAEGETFVEYSYLHPRGIEIVKRFELDSNPHLLRVTVRLKNVAGGEAKIRLGFAPIDGVIPDGIYQHEIHSAGFVGHRKGDQRAPEFVLAAKLEGDGRAFDAKGLDWIGSKNRYFAVALIPAGDATHGRLAQYRMEPISDIARALDGGMPGMRCVVHTSEIAVGAEPVSLDFVLFAGPVQPKVLEEAPGKLTVLYDPSGFDFVAGAILGLLKFFHSVLGNYGIAILLTTFLIRLALFPLSKKSQVSAFRMQALQPKVQVLKQRYSEDPQKMQKEMMLLFREHGVNPMSGCLPILLQLPVFVAMFSVYNESIELRQAPFFFWIHDLSQPDRLAGPFAEPFPLLLFRLWEINVLPVLMMITWFLQAYFAPKSPDPQMRMQQKMFMAMPVVFGFMCYSYASGLSLYFFVNSLLAMAEQKLIKKYFLKPAAKAA